MKSLKISERSQRIIGEGEKNPFADEIFQLAMESETIIRKAPILASTNRFERTSNILQRNGITELFV